MKRTLKSCFWRQNSAFFRTGKSLASAALPVYLAFLITGLSFADNPSDSGDQVPQTMTVKQFMNYSKEYSHIVGQYIVHCLKNYINAFESQQVKTPQEAEYHKAVSTFLNKLVNDKGPLLDEINRVFIEIHKSEGGDDLEVCDVFYGFIDEKVPKPTDVK